MSATGANGHSHSPVLLPRPSPRSRKPPPPARLITSSSARPPAADSVRSPLTRSASLQSDQRPSSMSTGNASASPKIPPKPHPRPGGFSKPPMPLPPQPRHGLGQQSPSSDKSTSTDAPATPGSASPLMPRLQKQLTLSEAMTLRDLVENYSDKFPLRIKVVQGYEGATSQLCLSNSDVYNVHFVQHRKVVGIQDGKGNTYSVPLNSSARFGIVYTHGETSSSKGSKTYPLNNPLRFSKVSDITALDDKKLPTVVCATKSHEGVDETSSVLENEVLIILGIHRPKPRGKKGLRAFSVSKKEHKFLPPECSGHFTTDPALVHMQLPEIVEYISTPFPCQAVLFLGSDFESCNQYVSDSLLTGTVTMIESKVETSLIVSAVFDPISLESPSVLTEAAHLDIPLDDCLSNVEVAVIETDNYEGIYEDTRNLLETLDLSKVTSYKDTGSAQTYRMQSALYTTFQKGREKYGIDVDVPRAAFQHTKQPLQPFSAPGLTRLATSEDDNAYEPISISGTPPAVDKVEESREYDSADVVIRGRESTVSSGRLYDRVSDEMIRPQAHASSETTFSNVSHLRDAYVFVRSSTPPDEPEHTAPQDQGGGEGDELAALVEKLTRRVESLEKQVQHLGQCLRDSGKAGRPGKATVNGESKEPQNVRHLKTLNCQQIQALLHNMNLRQYKQAFAEEQVNGDILSGLTDEDLQNELGIAKRLHRLRILRIINGQDSVMEQ